MKVEITFLLLLAICGHQEVASAARRSKSGPTGKEVRNIIIDKTAGGPIHVPEPVPEGCLLTLSYTNVNPFLYKSGVTMAVINRNYEDGLSAFSQAQNATTASGERDEVSKNSAATLGIASEQGTNKEDQALISHHALGLGGNIPSLKERHKAAKKTAFDKRLYSNLSKTPAEFSRIASLLQQKIEGLNRIEILLADIQREIITIQHLMSLDTIIKAAMKEPYNRSAIAMAQDIASRSGFTASEPSELRSAFHSSIQNIYLKTSDINVVLASLDMVNAELRKDTAQKFDTVIAVIRKNVTDIRNAYTGSNCRVLNDNMDLIINNYVRAVRSEYTVTADTILVADGDYVRIQDPAMGISNLKIRTYGGIRIDFSAGIAFTGGDINGWGYTLNKVNDSTTYLITDRENRHISTGLAAMMHLYRTRKTHTAWMLSFGAAPDFSELASSRFFLGGSFAAFSTNNVDRRFILSVGLACGGAEVLKPKYREKSRATDNNFHSFGNISESDLTERSFRLGAFIALTYNLGGIGH